MNPVPASRGGQLAPLVCVARIEETPNAATFVFAKPLLLFLKGKGYVPVYRLRSPRIFAVEGMNWAIPSAPAGLTA